MKKYIYMLFIFVCIFSLVSCKKKKVDISDNNDGIENKPLVELDSSEIFKKVNPSVILIFTRTISGDIYSGTGFFIDDKGTFITNYHVIDKAESILIKTADDRFGEAIRFVSVNQNQDIAILQADVTSTPVEIGDSSTIEVGDKVYTIGYPAITVMGVSSPTFTDGMISKVKQNVDDREYIQTTVSITNGNSGGPLINKYGQVIGITSAGFNYDNIDWANLAIGINHAKNLIELSNTEENLVKYYFRQEIPYIIQFFYNGEQYNIQTAFYNNKITKPIDPIKSGYYVKAWIDAVTLEEFDFNTPIKNDYILTPFFEKNTYTISFNTDGGTKIPDASFKYEESVDLSKYVPVKEGYTFIGWDQNITTMPYNNVTLNANWIPNTNTKYQVDYYYENEIGEYEFRESKINYGTTGEIINVPMITGYTLQYEELKISGDGSTILKCNVSEIKLTIKYHSNNGDKVKSEDVKISKANEYNMYEPSKEGLTFECWYEGENADRIFNISNYVNIDKDVELSLYAKYKEETLWTYFTYGYNQVYKFQGEISDISIPSYILDEEIIMIHRYFAYSNTILNSVIIPNTVTSIGDSAFYNCYSLTSIEIPASVTSIEKDAFYKCSNLENVYYNGTIEDWCNIEFSDVYSNPMCKAVHFYMKDSNNEYYEVTQIEIPNTVISIGYQFYSFDKITKVFIPNSVTSIGNSAFSSCNSLTSIVIPDSVTSIGYHAFSYCDSLTIYCESTSKPSGWDSDWNYSKKPVYFGVNENNFVEIDNLQYILDLVNNTAIVSRYTGIEETVEILSTITHNNIEYNVISIGRSAFRNCSSLESIVIPDSVTSIGVDAFYNCRSLESIVIPSSVTSIGVDAFYNCRSLESIVIPDSVTSIGDSTFAGCSSLESIVIPDSVTSIGLYAFFGCSSLESIVIPDSVTSIGKYAFYNCRGLTIYCEATSKPSGWSGEWSGYIKEVIWGYKC